MAYLVSSDLYIFPPFGSILCYHLIAGDADDFELQTSHFNPENSAEADQTPQGRITIRLLGYFVPPEVDLSIESRIRFLGVFRSCAGDLVFFVFFFSLFFVWPKYICFVSSSSRGSRYFNPPLKIYPR